MSAMRQIRKNPLWALALIAALGVGVSACSSGSKAPPAPADTMEPMEPEPDPADAERAEIKMKIEAAQTAVSAVDDDSTDADVMAADNAIKAAEKAIADAANVPAEEKAANTGTVTALKTQLSNAKESRMTAMDDAQRAADMAMAATAAKLYAGISAQMGAGDGSTFAATDRDAYYNADATAILVSIGDGTNVHTEVSATLSEDKKTMVAANHGWAGKRYADPAGGDMYEAVVYSNVEAPKMGKKFGGTAANDEYQYALTDGALTAAQIAPANVALTGVTRTAGTETFKLPDPNPGEATVINVPGSYHGVAGTYNCDTTDGTGTCTAAVAGGGGFTLGGTGTWTFKPGNAEARVTDAADTAYASYGWWLKKAANDGPFTASAFVDEKGTVAAASGLNALDGTATYRGGAAGKYALSSSTGGTNDAGHFTARATLEADFTNNDEETAITGTIDMFRGADGMARDWSVKLNGSQIGDDGEIGNASDSTNVQTVWTIGGTAAEKSGNWTGTLRNNGDDGVPQVATGTFYSEYGQAGKMVGGFGANLQ